MVLKDHISIGMYLLENSGIKFGKLQKIFFLLGCIEPDINPFTYLKGSYKNAILRGHNFDNSLNFLLKKIVDVQKIEKYRLQEFYTIGKIIHYLVDDFTYPHNTIFKEGIIKHCAYENVLHKEFSNYLKIKHNINNFNYIEKHEIVNYVIRIHTEYIKGLPSHLKDCKYILMVSLCVNNAFLSDFYLSKDKVA